MSYISTCTAEMLYYHKFNDEAKEEFHHRMTNRDYKDMPDWFKEVFMKLSLNVKKYVEAETKEEQHKIWLSYDSYSQYLCSQDKYDEFYKDKVI